MRDPIRICGGWSVGAVLLFSSGCAQPEASTTAVPQARYRSYRSVPVTEEYKAAIMEAWLPLISDYCKKLELPCPYPLSSNHVARVGASGIIDGRLGDIGAESG